MTAQIFIPFLTILFSGLLATIVTHYLTTSHQEKQFNRQKLEELYFAMDGFCTFFGTFNAYWPGVVEGKIDYNAALDKARSDRKNERFHQTAEMRKDKHCVDLISDVLPFGRLWYGEPMQSQMQSVTRSITAGHTMP